VVTIKELSEVQKEDLKRKKLFLFDMDGTIYLDDDLFAGVLELLDYVRQIGGRSVFVTNNSSKNVSGYVEKLHRLGIAATADDLMTSTRATGLYLQKAHTDGKIYVLGTQALYDALNLEYHLPVTKELEPDITCLTMGFDTELTFQKLEDACRLLTKPDLCYIATNPDFVCPVSFGYVPDCGSVTQILYNATKRMPKVIGKPEATMALLAMKKYGFTKEETLMIGDRIYTDIACGVNAGVCALLVLSGESTMQTVAESKIKPDIILPDIHELYHILTDTGS
jgi:HAD superfamily hydrolase (TIGR01450 family)